MPLTRTYQTKSLRARPRDPAALTVVAMGASAGGLEACTKLVSALPASTPPWQAADGGTAFILVQHLDPTHASMMVELLTRHTSMTVTEAADGTPLRPDHLYVIPPGAYIAVKGGRLALSKPEAPRGARLPFDFLLRSLAAEFGAHVVCVVLSGTGADGTKGSAAVKAAGGVVIVQDPEEAGYAGMPRSAIQSGAADMVLPAAEIAAALARRARPVATPADPARANGRAPADPLAAVVELLRTKTVHDFSLYKRGTLQRRIARRMAVAGIGANGTDRYLDILRADAGELEALANSLLINVTSFFRDPKVFDVLAEKVVPALVAEQPADRPIRIWIAGCSTGEETYSLAMLFREQIAASRPEVKLQVFASDVDADAVAAAREGLYPKTIAADVSAARLARFFTEDDQGYRVSPDLRALVVFTVQDVLADPPFSRLDLVSCRNLLIYLRPEAQARVISLFDFALREGGVLVLGGAETAGALAGRFKAISKPERLYRHTGRGRPSVALPFDGGGGLAVRAPPGPAAPRSRQSFIAELGRRLVLESYAPAAVLINARHECLFSMGPTERYLRVAPGHATHDLLAVVRPGLRTKLRALLQSAERDKKRVAADGGKLVHEGRSIAFRIEVQPVADGAEKLLLVCFVDEPAREPARRGSGRTAPGPRAAELEHELALTRAELRDVVRDLELSSEEQKAINEEALSVNEEYQSTNEELLTSKEELQSLNEELTALNSQLQETLERQRTTSDDLQNVLYSSDVATLFLDVDLKIRFFTPAVKSVFAVIPGDIGRPLSDLHSLAPESDLLAEAQAVLRGHDLIEREIEAAGGAWLRRRILPYRVHGGGVEGVVITFTDITRRKRAASALEAAKQEAERADAAKSRFLAAASHDLRQPLQTLALLQGLLASTVESDGARKLVARLDETLGAMSGMLNTLLDVNQIEAGLVQAEMADVEAGGLLDRLRDEFTYHAQAKGIALRVVRCSLSIRSDPRLLEQMLRNLLSNAIKYTTSGKVLLGCRRRAGIVSIEVWDTGIGIPDTELQAIFEEYRQIDNAARERSRGLGLGLSIVRRLGDLLGHEVRVRSRHGKGSVFAVEVARAAQAPAPHAGEAGAEPDRRAGVRAPCAGTVLVVEDDPEIRDLLERFLQNEGYRAATAVDGTSAVELAAQRADRPDVLLADYNLPGGMTGLEVVVRLRMMFGARLPAIILTGDISTATMREVAMHDCVRMTKPIKLPALAHAIRELLPPPPERAAAAAGAGGAATVFIVDDDAGVRDAIRAVVEDDGRSAAVYADGEAFIDAFRPGPQDCVVIDACLPGMSGIEVLRRLREAGHAVPAIMITGRGAVGLAVEALKAGASDFIEKPVGRVELLAGIDRAIEQQRDAGERLAWKDAAAARLAGLTPRQNEIMALVLAGHPSKNIAADLGISQRTVENHRAAIMQKTGSKSLPALARLALAAAWKDGAPEPPTADASAA